FLELLLRLSSLTVLPAHLHYSLSLHDALPISTPDRHLDVRADLLNAQRVVGMQHRRNHRGIRLRTQPRDHLVERFVDLVVGTFGDRKSTRLNSSHVSISYAVFCLKQKLTGAEA